MSYASDPVNVEVKGPNPWLPLVILGVLTGVLGIWMMVSAIAGTKLSLGVITLMLALGLFLSGLSELAWASDRESPMVGYVLGALSIIAAIVVLIHPGVGLTALAVFIGIVLILVGAAQTVVAFMGREELTHWAALAVFGVVTMLSRRGFDAQRIDDLKGLNDRSPWLAFMMMLILFSMAGVPPTVGFFAKLFVLDAVVSIDLVWLALVAVFFSIIGAFYYLRAVKVMYFDKPVDDEPIAASLDTQIVLSVNGLAILGFGLFPAALLAACRTAFTG